MAKWHGGETLNAGVVDDVWATKKRKPIKSRTVKTLLTDEQVLECRAKFEFQRGHTKHSLAAEYGVSLDYMERLLDYTLRSKLIPRRPDA